MGIGHWQWPVDYGMGAGVGAIGADLAILRRYIPLTMKTCSSCPCNFCTNDGARDIQLATLNLSIFSWG